MAEVSGLVQRQRPLLKELAERGFELGKDGRLLVAGENPEILTPEKRVEIITSIALEVGGDALSLVA